MFIRIVASALFAGAAAGLITGLLQLTFVQPLLLHAELYESGTLTHFGSGVVSAVQDLGGVDFARDGLSVLFTMAVYIGYSFILVAAMALAQELGHDFNIRSGILWGAAGFIAFHLAPAFSLAPEVPGAAAAEMVPRQMWWVSTVIAASIAMWLLAFGKSWLAWGASVVLLLAPHIIGAPQPEYFTGRAPTELGALFASRALGVGLMAWVLTGLFASYFWQRNATDKNS